MSRKDIRATEDAEGVKLLKAAGAIALCVTNVSELGSWWNSINNVYGTTNNPHSVSHCPGGSSGILKHETIRTVSLRVLYLFILLVFILKEERLLFRLVQVYTRNVIYSFRAGLSRRRVSARRKTLFGS